MIYSIIKNINQLNYKKLNQLGEYIYNLGESDILRLYEGYGPKFKALLMLLEREGIYISKEIFELVINGNLINKHKTPISYARQELQQLTKWNKRTRTIAKASKLDWEQLSQQFVHRNTADKVKQEIWEISLPKRSLEEL